MDSLLLILELQPGATKDEVKKSFRRLAHLYHPDKPGGNADKFKRINGAYQDLCKMNLEVYGSKHSDPVDWGGPNKFWENTNGFSMQWNRHTKMSEDLADLFAEMMKRQAELNKMHQRDIDELHRRMMWGQ